MNEVVALPGCPFEFDVQPMARFLNAELTDHPVYDGVELQWFDDALHGTGMLAFLSRRADRRVDYYVDPALSVDRAGYEIGGGTGAWTTIAFAVDRLEVGPRGVFADVRFTDVDGRDIEIQVDDRARPPRRSSDLLAPVGSGIDAPASLLLVYLHGFDLVRRSRRPPRVLIDGEAADTGRLPGAALHRRHLIKAAAPLSVATLCPTREDHPLSAPSGAARPIAAADGFRGIAVVRDGAGGRFLLDPPMPDLAGLSDGAAHVGDWQIEIDGAPITGGRWRAWRHGMHAELSLEVTRPWSPPAGRPLLMRIVTRVIPIFRSWPTTYRWTATVDLAASPPRITSRWVRTGKDRAEAYRRATSGRRRAAV